MAYKYRLLFEKQLIVFSRSLSSKITAVWSCSMDQNSANVDNVNKPLHGEQSNITEKQNKQCRDAGNDVVSFVKG